MYFPKLLKLRKNGDIIPLPAYACRQGQLYRLSLVLLRGHNNPAPVSAFDPWLVPSPRKEGEEDIGLK